MMNHSVLLLGRNSAAMLFRISGNGAKRRSVIPRLPLVELLGCMSPNPAPEFVGFLPAAVTLPGADWLRASGFFAGLAM